MKLSELSGDAMLRTLDTINFELDTDDLPDGRYVSTWRKFEIQNAETGEVFEGVHFQFCEAATGDALGRVVCEFRLLAPATKSIETHWRFGDTESEGGNESF